MDEKFRDIMYFITRHGRDIPQYNIIYIIPYHTIYEQGIS